MNLMGISIAEPLVQALGWTLLHSLWQGLVIFVLYRAVLSFINPSQLKSRYIISVAALLLIPLTSAVTFAQLYPEPAVSAGISTLGPQMHPILRTTSTIFHTIAGDTTQGHFSIRIWYNSFLTFLNGHMDYIAIVWMAGMLAFLLRMTGGYFYLHRLKWRHASEAGETWEKRLDLLKARMNIRYCVRLLESEKVGIPSVIGFLKPVILVPAGALSQIPADQMEAILVHELAHILRKDYLINVVQVLIEALFFYHPVVWWLSGRIRTEREFICDDLSLTYCPNPLVYLKALTSVQELSQRSPLFTAALASGKNQLLIRIKRIVSPHSNALNNSGGSIMLPLTLAIVTVAAGTAFAIKAGPDTDQAFSTRLSGREIPNFSMQQPTGNISFFPGLSSPYRKTDPALSGHTGVIADTTSKADTVALKERQAGEEYKKQLQEQEMAHKQLQEAIEEHQKALQQYLEIQRQQRQFRHQEYYEALREAEKRLQEQYFKDSLDRSLPHCQVPPGDFYFDFGPGVHSFVWPEDSAFQWNYQKFMESYFDFDTSWTNVYEELDSIGGYHYFYDPRDPEQVPEDERFNYPIPYDLKLPDIYYTYPDMEDLYRHEELLLPDVPDVEEKYLIPFHGNIQRTESIMKSELLGDGIITRENDYVVFIDSGMMSVNGEKQPREVYKKYKRLVETATGEELKKGLTFFF